MTPEKWDEVKEIFNQAVELSTAEREKFLANRIDGDAEMRREVEKLLAADEHAETLFDGKSLIAPKHYKANERIGNYQIIKKIGEGGMGAVYLAERADVKQRVALKIIRHGADSEIILRRFRRERRTLKAIEIYYKFKNVSSIIFWNFGIGQIISVQIVQFHRVKSKVSVDC